MSQINHTVESRKNKHLTEKERYRIETLLKEGFKPLENSKEVYTIKTVETKDQISK